MHVCSHSQPNPSQVLQYVVSEEIRWSLEQDVRAGSGCEQIKALNPLVHKHLPFTEGPADTPTGQPAAWGMITGN